MYIPENIVQYQKQINDGTFKFENVADLVKEIVRTNSFTKTHDIVNSNLDIYKNLLDAIKPQISRFYKCEEGEISTQKIIYRNNLDQKYMIALNNVYVESKRRSLEGLVVIGGNFYFADNLYDIGDLTIIGGETGFSSSKITNLKKLNAIYGNANFNYSRVKNLGDLSFIGGDVDFSNSKCLKELFNLKVIKGDANFSNSSVEDLKDLRYIGGDLNLIASRVKSIDNIKYIGGVVYVDKNTPQAIMDRLIKDENGQYHLAPEKISEDEIENV